MPTEKIIKQSVMHAVAAVLYIVIIAAIMSRAERIFGQGEDGVLAPILFLLLFVVSAATMGMLIFGKPVMLYIDGKKREGVEMAMSRFNRKADVGDGMWEKPHIRYPRKPGPDRPPPTSHIPYPTSVSRCQPSLIPPAPPPVS